MLVIGFMFIVYSVIGYFFKGTTIADRIKVASSAFSILLSFSKILKVSTLASERRKKSVRIFSDLVFYLSFIVGGSILINIGFINEFLDPLYNYLVSGYAMFLSFGITICNISFQEISESFELKIKELGNNGKK